MRSKKTNQAVFSEVSIFDTDTLILGPDSLLERAVGTSKAYFIGINVEFPEKGGVIVPTDYFWRSFGFDEGVRYYQSLHAGIIGSDLVTEEKIKSLNDSLRKKLC